MLILYRDDCTRKMEDVNNDGDTPHDGTDGGGTGSSKPETEYTG